MTMGIYEVVNTINDKKYIGSSVNIEKRFDWHRSALRNSFHWNPHLQRSWDKHGENMFQFRILIVCTNPNILLVTEQAFIDNWKPEYNMGSAIGGPMPETTKQKIRLKQLGRLNSFYGKKHTEETKYKMRRWQQNRPPLSKEARQKISIANKGRPSKLRGRILSEETKRKMSVAKMGTIFSVESRQKMANAKAGLYPSFTGPNGIMYSSGRNLRAFCRQHKLDSGAMCRVVRGKQKSHLGWRLTKCF